MNQIDAMNWRYATKQFDSTKTLTEEQLETLLEVLRLTPSSFGLQPWRFIVISNKEMREELVQHSFGQRQVAECSHLVVLTAKNDITPEYIDSYIEDTANSRGVGVDTLEGYKKMLLGFTSMMDSTSIRAWADKQVYIALGTLMTAAANMHIDTCPMEGFDKAEYDKVLALEEQGYHSVAICPLGFRDAEDKYAKLPKVRFASEEVIQRID